MEFKLNLPMLTYVLKKNESVTERRNVFHRFWDSTKITHAGICFASKIFEAKIQVSKLACWTFDGVNNFFVPLRWVLLQN